jgi:tetratricopeptide (TPR) repeat protein
MWGDALQPLASDDWQTLLAELPTVWRQQLARLVPDLTAPPADDIEGATFAESQLRLRQGVVRGLTCLNRFGPLVLVFEDIHWADEVSLELLHYTARHLAESNLLVVGTYRPEVAIDNPSLDPILEERNDGPVTRVLRLRALDQERTGRLLANLETELPSEMLEHLHRYCEGNPFVLIETVRTLLEAGDPTRGPGDRPVRSEGHEFPIAPGVQDLIQTRLTALSEEQRRVLNAAAIIGRPFSLQLLRQVSGLSELQLLDFVEQLVRRAFLQERREAMPYGSLYFHHNYFRQVIYDGLSTVRKQVLHRRVAESLLARHRVRPEAITEEVAYHFEQAGDVRAVSYLLQAGQQAEGLFAYDHAVELYSRAITFHQHFLPDDLVGQFDLLLGREAVLDRQGRRAEQSEDVATLMKLADRVGYTERQALACLRQAGFLANIRQHQAARRMGEQAIGLYRQVDDKAGQARAWRELGFLHWATGDYGTALTYCRNALQLHRQLGDIEGEATALHNLAEIYRDLGSPRQALTQYEQALSLYWARQDQRRQGLTFYGMAHALRQMGQKSDAFSRYHQALVQCQAAGDRLMTSRVHHTLAGLHWDTGSLDQAIEHMQQALEISREIGYGSGIAHGLIALSYLFAQLGEIVPSLEHLREAISWLKLIEDEAGVAEAQAQLQALENGSLEPVALPIKLGWVKDHVVFAEGKVYCEFESPMART